jgi:hypothetical protein
MGPQKWSDCSATLNHSVQPSEAGLNVRCCILTHDLTPRELSYFLLAWGPAAQCRTRHRDGAHKKQHSATQQNSINASQVGRPLNLT